MVNRSFLFVGLSQLFLFNKKNVEKLFFDLLAGTWNDGTIQSKMKNKTLEFLKDKKKNIFNDVKFSILKSIKINIKAK